MTSSKTCWHGICFQVILFFEKASGFKQIGMGAGALKEKEIIDLAVDDNPIRLYMKFSVPLPLTF
jgi:hypothetical protein